MIGYEEKKRGKRVNLKGLEIGQSSCRVRMDVAFLEKGLELKK